MQTSRMRPEIYKGDAVRSAEGVPLGTVSELYARRGGLPKLDGPPALQDSFLMVVERRKSGQTWFIPTRYIAEIAAEVIRLDRTMADLEAAGVDQPPGYLDQGEGMTVYIFDRRLDG